MLFSRCNDTTTGFSAAREDGVKKKKKEKICYTHEKEKDRTNTQRKKTDRQKLTKWKRAQRWGPERCTRRARDARRHDEGSMNHQKTRSKRQNSVRSAFDEKKKKKIIHFIVPSINLFRPRHCLYHRRRRGELCAVFVQQHQFSSTSPPNARAKGGRGEKLLVTAAGGLPRAQL